MANIVRPAVTHTDTSPIETHTNTPTSEIATPLSPTTIGLVCGLGGCGILGFFIWAIVYFRWFKPIEMRIKEGGARDYNTPTAERNKNKNRNSTITNRRKLTLYGGVGDWAQGLYEREGEAVSGRLEQGEEIEDLLTGLERLQKYVKHWL
ncbi:unnamed protein product [Alternaria sp. RS040]